MPRLFFGNFDFEHELADPTGWRTPPTVRRLLAERASAWIAIAEDGDLIWTPEPIPDSFWEELAAAGLPRVSGVTDISVLPTDKTQLVPWGWSRSTIRISQSTLKPSDESVRLGNSRRWSFDFEQEFDVALPGAARLERLDDFSVTVANSAGQFAEPVDSQAWVIKANFGMAARERILGRGTSLSEQQQRWVLHRLAADGAVYFEPWLPIRAEVGLQFTIPPLAVGTPRLEGITPLLTDSQGGYRGSRFSRDEVVAEKWQPAIEVAFRAAERLQELGYFGPLGIDAAEHKLLTGDVMLRPLQDINARFTMGRLALGFRRLLRAGESGTWRHFLAHETTVDSPASGGRQSSVSLRVIPTSPPIVGKQPTQHRSAVLISEDSCSKLVREEKAGTLISTDLR